MIDLGAFSSSVERTVSSKEEQDRAFARDAERMKKLLELLNQRRANEDKK